MGIHLTYGSVCSGIEAATVAWHPLGWKAEWLAEIDEAPSAVLRWRMPDTPNYGDMLKLADYVELGIIAAPDILVGGTPCQSFSVAGVRKGLKDKRGQLTIAYVRLADAIDKARKHEGKPPVIIVWENVPGILTHRENPFGSFIGFLVGEDCEIRPPGGKWTYAGLVSGPQRAATWRVLDSQYFGVAQRRRRVFVVASARTDIDLSEILPEFESMRRDTPPSREARQEVAAHARGGAETGGAGLDGRGGRDARVQREGRPNLGSHWDGAEVHPSLCSGAAQTGGIGYSNQEIFSQRGGRLVPGFGGHPVGARMQAFGKYEMDDTASMMKARDYKDATDLVIHPLLVAHGTQDPLTMEDCAFPLGRNNGQENAVCITGEVTHTLKADGFDGSEDGTGRGQPIVAIPIHDQATRFAGKRGKNQDGKGNGLGIGREGDPMLTLTAGDRHAVAYPLDLRNAGRDPDKRDAVNRQGLGVGTESDPSPTVTTAFVPGVATFKPGQSAAARGVGYAEEVAPTLEGGGGGNNKPALFQFAEMAVRRLTPTECERLQGFPDNWTKVPYRKAHRKYLTQPREGFEYVEIDGECWQLMPDGPRYKACGNSFTTLVVRWIGNRIERQIVRAMMPDLFG